MQIYTPTKVWKDGFGAGETRITAADLTRMEAGISAASQGVTNVETRMDGFASTLESRLATTLQSAVNAAKVLLPVGAVTMFAGTTAPLGWVLCNGQLLDRTAYASLFQVLGTSYGNTSATNFRVPDFRGLFPVGAGGDYAVGAKGGAATVSLGVNNLPAHTHGVTSDKFAQGVGLYKSNVAGGTGWTVLSTTESGADGALVTKPTGQGVAHENRPPYLAMSFIIKAQ